MEYLDNPPRKTITRHFPVAVRSASIHGIDLFAGAGGLSLGAALAGISVSHAVENHYAAAATYRQNHKTTQLHEQDIRTINSLPLPRKGKRIVFGGPPCQGFSTSNQRTRTLENPRNWLFSDFFRLAASADPHWIILENVKGLRETAQGKFESLIFQSFRDLGFAVELWTLCAADFGVPQKRDRLFFVGRKNGSLPRPPSPYIGSALTVRDAISDLPELSVGANIDELGYRTAECSSYASERRESLASSTGHLVTANSKLVVSRYRYIPQGGNWTNIPPRLMKNYSNLTDARSRHTGIYRRLKWDEPSVVIANYRKNMLVHPDQHRGLSVREAARIQSFPDSYRFSGSIGFQQQQVSNAVPPLLAAAVFKHILKHL